MILKTAIFLEKFNNLIKKQYLDIFLKSKKGKNTQFNVHKIFKKIR